MRHKIRIKINLKVKGDGQECPSHMVYRDGGAT